MWTGSTFLSQSLPIVIGSGSSNSPDCAVNIDADENSNWIVVWNDGLSDALLAITGDHSAATINVVSATFPTSIGVTGLGWTPDVCLYGDNSDRVTYTYISMDGDLFVDYDSFDDIQSGTATPVNVYYTSPTHDFYYPRIACPNYQAGTREDWTVVVEDNDGATEWLIRGYNDNNTTITSHIYNDGSLNSPLDITDYMNIHPAVAYNSQSTPTVMVGWTMDDLSGDILSMSTSQGPAAVAMYPIVVRCDDDGVMQSIEYYDVPNTITVNDIAGFLSLAGRNGGNLLFSTFFMMGDVYTTVVTSISSSSGLRIGNEPNHEDSTIISIRIFDVEGRLIQSNTAPNLEMERFLNNFKQNQQSGIYLVEQINSSGEIKYSKISTIK